MEKTSGMAIAALVLGILGFFTGWIPFLGMVMPVIAIILGFLALSKIKNNPEISGRGMAIAGIVLGFLGLALSMLGIIGAIAFFGVLQPTSFMPSRCDIGGGLDCTEAPVFGTDTASFKVTNNRGTDITVTRLLGDATSDCAMDNDISDIAIKDGESAVMVYKAAKPFSKDGTVRCKFNIEFVMSNIGATNMANAYLSGKAS